MVTETVIETPVVDPVQPELPVQTEGDPVEVVVDEPETETTAAAEEEPEVEAAAPKEPVYTAAELKVEAARLAREQSEYERSLRQSENARRVAKEQRDAQDQTRLNRYVKSVLLENGADMEPEAVTNLLKEFTDERQGQWFDGVKSDVDVAADFLRARLVEDTPPVLNDRQQEIAGRMQVRFNEALGAAADKWAGYIGENFIPKADLDKYVKAEITRQEAKKNEGKAPLKSVNGAPTPNDNSPVSDRLDRIGTSRETPADRQWWNEREKMRGRG